MLKRLQSFITTRSNQNRLEERFLNIIISVIPFVSRLKKGREGWNTNDRIFIYYLADKESILRIWLLLYKQYD